MRYGFVFPLNDVNKAVAWAKEAEAAGWDGFFVADLTWGMDAWVTLAAAATATDRIRLGTMVTPLAWARPWKLASETATLDHLSKGRVILSVGLGANDAGAADFGLVTDRKTKAELVDEGLEILNGLWQGKPIRHQSAHYRIKPTAFPPPPPTVQQPRIPIWMVGAWPFEKSLRRVAGCDGWLAAKLDSSRKYAEFTPDELPTMIATVQKLRTLKTPLDVVIEGTTKSQRDNKKIQEWAGAGATWWIESMWGKNEAAILKRLRQGPPK